MLQRFMSAVQPIFENCQPLFGNRYFFRILRLGMYDHAIVKIRLNPFDGMHVYDRLAVRAEKLLRIELFHQGVQPHVEHVGSVFIRNGERLALLRIDERHVIDMYDMHFAAFGDQKTGAI